MTRDDIIKLAKWAALPRVVISGYDDELERFAALVAEAEREECAKVFDGDVWSYDYREIATAIRARGEK